MARRPAGERRQEILETLARLLRERRGEPITTAILANAVGVSEAALYRHFPSKAKMYEALLEFIEGSLFSRINRILAEEPAADTRVHHILHLVLAFAEKNPGISSLLQGGALVGETEQLRVRAGQIYDRIETHIRQVLREAEAKSPHGLRAAQTASLCGALIEGRIARFVRTGFQVSPLAGFAEEWDLLRPALFPVAGIRL